MTRSRMRGHALKVELGRLALGPGSTGPEVARLGIVRAADRLVEAALLATLVEPESMPVRRIVAVALEVQRALIDDAKAGGHAEVDALPSRMMATEDPI